MSVHVTSPEFVGSRIEAPAPNREAHSSGVSWSAVIGGAFVAAALYLILLALGAGFGLSAVSPWSNVGLTAPTASAVAIAWLVIIEIVASAFGGYLAGASMSTEGTIFLSGERMDVYISWDRGRSWHESPSLENAAGMANAGFPLVGLTVTDTIGFAFQEGVYPRQVWLSRDGGHHWTSVTIR